jgi:apolipoprotein N-acyltransferase
VGWVAAGLCAALAGWLKAVLTQKPDETRVRRGAAALVCVLGASSAALALLAQTAWGQWGQTAGTFSVTLLQGNIAQNEKFDQQAGVPQALQWYAQAIAQAKGQLIVAPETAIAVLPQQLPPAYLPQVQRSMQQPGGSAQALLIGIPWGDPQAGYTNAVMALDAQSNPTDWASLYRYDKHHLVPFGEFIPPFFRWFTSMMNIPLGDFNRGTLNPAPYHQLGQRLAPNICYEDLFGEELAARFMSPERAPTVMVNLSNIGWFGDSVAIDQHLQISRMRTLELQRPMIRATNTGASAVINHQGQVLWSLPRLQQAQATGLVEARTGTITPYAHWASRGGLLPLWALCLALMVGLCQPWKRWVGNHADSL